MTRVLVTGFGPFGRVVDNPSARLATSAVGVDSIVLPTSFARAPAMLRAATEGKGYDVVLLLGVAEGQPEFGVERCGRNVVSARIPDVDGAMPVGVVVEGAPEVIAVTLDVARVHGALRAPSRLSDSAGTYVCNALLFHALHAAVAPRVGFLHVPPDEQTLATPSPHTMLFQQQRAVLGRVIDALRS
ncbi:MAG: hypothetical protein JNL79_25215 [Myxococcales bacterium]|nr:hypothetical protein [Myxococcales bacterium]